MRQLGEDDRRMFCVGENTLDDDDIVSRYVFKNDPRITSVDPPQQTK